MKQFSMPNGVGGSKWRCCAEIEASRSSGLRQCREATMKNLRVGSSGVHLTRRAILLVFRLYELVITLRQVRAWTPA
jgi:hypothetical protein